MPGGRQVKPGHRPSPPAARSARLASKTAWYSWVRGASWPRPRGLLGSNAGWPGGEIRVHCPFKSGYFASSNAWAPAAASAVASTIEPIELRRMTAPLAHGDFLLSPSLAGCFEVAQIGRRLVLLGRHEVAVRAQEIIFLADGHMLVALAAIVLDPDRLAHAAVFLGDRPRTGERRVDRGDLVVEEVAVGFVEIDPLLDDGLIVPVQGKAAALERAGPLHAAGLDHEHVVAAVAVLVDPLADGVAGEGRLEVLGPGASVGIDPARHVAFEQDVRGVRQDDDFHREDDAHHPRHANRETGISHVVAVSACRLVRQAGLENGLIFGGQGGLLPAPQRFARVPLDA